MVDYITEIYGLFVNPFDNRTAYENQLYMWFNREEQLNEWRRILEHSVNSNSNIISFIIGDYGRGKTFSLFKIGDLIKEEFINEICAVYFKLISEEKSKPGIDVFYNLFRWFNFENIKKNRNLDEIRKAIDSLPDEFTEQRNLFSKIFLTPIKNQAALTDYGIVNDRDGDKKLRISETYKIAKYYITGDKKPSAKQKKMLGIQRDFNNVEIAKDYFISLLWILKKLQYKSLVLTIDEFEYLFSLVTKSNQNIYLALFRGLYDLPAGRGISKNDLANIVIFFAISEEGWLSLDEMRNRQIGSPINPLMHRAESPTFLRSFTKEESESLIKLRLSLNRPEGKFEDKPLIPYTKDFIDYIWEKTLGMPRDIIKICDVVLMKGLAERKTKLDRSFAITVLEESGIS